MKRMTIVVAGVLAGALSLGAKPAGEKGGGAAKAKLEAHAADQLQWKDAGQPGVQVAPLWGDMSKNGDWGALIKFKAGTDVGWHTHTGGTQLVVVSGTLAIEPDGGPVVELGPGSHAAEPPKMPHRTVCKDGADCVFALHMTKKFDFIKGNEPGAAKAKQ